MITDRNTSRQTVSPVRRERARAWAAEWASDLYRDGEWHFQLQGVYDSEDGADYHEAEMNHCLDLLNAHLVENRHLLGTDPRWARDYATIDRISGEVAQ